MWENLWCTGEDRPGVSSPEAEVCLEHTCISSVLVSLRFSYLIWCLQTLCAHFMRLGTIYCQACLNSKICFQFQKPQIIYQIGKEMEVIELISYIIFNFLSEYWHLPAVRVMCSSGRSSNGEEMVKSDESCQLLCCCMSLLLMLNA